MIDGKMVMRVKPSQTFKELCALYEREFPGLTDKADKLYACCSIAGVIVEDHPDLSPAPGAVRDLSIALFSSLETVEDLPPDGEHAEE